MAFVYGLPRGFMLPVETYYIAHGIGSANLERFRNRFGTDTKSRARALPSVLANALVLGVVPKPSKVRMNRALGLIPKQNFTDPPDFRRASGMFMTSATDRIATPAQATSGDTATNSIDTTNLQRIRCTTKSPHYANPKSAGCIAD